MKKHTRKQEKKEKLEQIMNDMNPATDWYSAIGIVEKELKYKARRGAYNYMTQQGFSYRNHTAQNNIFLKKRYYEIAKDHLYFLPVVQRLAEEFNLGILTIQKRLKAQGINWKTHRSPWIPRFKKART